METRVYLVNHQYGSSIKRRQRSGDQTQPGTRALGFISKVKQVFRVTMHCLDLINGSRWTLAEFIQFAPKVFDMPRINLGARVSNLRLNSFQPCFNFPLPTSPKRILVFFYHQIRDAHIGNPEKFHYPFSVLRTSIDKPCSRCRDRTRAYAGKY